MTMHLIQLTSPGDGRSAACAAPDYVTLSPADQIRTQAGDVFETGAEGCGPPLRNALFIAASPSTAAKAHDAAALGEPHRKAAS